MFCYRQLCENYRRTWPCFWCKRQSRQYIRTTRLVWLPAFFDLSPVWPCPYVCTCLSWFCAVCWSVPPHPFFIMIPGHSCDECYMLHVDIYLYTHYICGVYQFLHIYHIHDVCVQHIWCCHVHVLSAQTFSHSAQNVTSNCLLCFVPLVVNFCWNQHALMHLN